MTVYATAQDRAEIPVECEPIRDLMVKAAFRKLFLVTVSTCLDLQAPCLCFAQLRLSMY